ncbi:hypothetical protein [Bradyrhizobium sp.]|uniref:hypothetical protein n=1 Tax=Bradyrhizobium sp. TaxID=376 RepID=UPI003C7A11CC
MILDNGLGRDAEPVPASDVGEQSRRQVDGWLTLVAFALAVGQTPKLSGFNAALQTATDLPHYSAVSRKKVQTVLGCRL